ncbi:ABC transporter ATP-binding protein [Holdemania filiformis]|uniref:ABC transporter ATP-binding protein n=1 Tax=Holdemania filiformis TaxID=61171 RepID=UPI0026766CD3|nr:ABC transporter ATP-binding protein [Holdemania filiformis]
MSITINIEHAKKAYGKNVVIENLSAQVKPGEFFTLLGPSGCGKTTLLRMIAGFNTIEGGEIKFDDRVINNLPPHKRNIGMVFQNYAVFPHMSTRENIAFGLKERKVREPELSNRVNEVLDKVQIRELAERMPSNMSGGQQQRIALARAMVINPDVLLFDEPLSNLDAKLRVEMRSIIRHIQQQAGITTIYVTHDQEEALAISDRIAVMYKGEIQQIDEPVKIYRKPKNLFVATFMGQTNILDVDIDNQDVAICGTDVHYHFDRIANQNHVHKGKLVVRPNDFTFADQGIEGTVVDRIFFGTITTYTLNTKIGELVVTRDVNEHMKEIGEVVHLDIPVNVVNVFEAEGHNLSIMGDAG